MILLCHYELLIHNCSWSSYRKTSAEKQLAEELALTKEQVTGLMEEGMCFILYCFIITGFFMLSL